MRDLQAPPPPSGLQGLLQVVDADKILPNQGNPRGVDLPSKGEGVKRPGLDGLNSQVKMKLTRVQRGQWDVLAICGPRGNCPLLEFLAGLEAQLAADGRAMLRLLSFVAEQGPPRNVDVSHKISGEVWELIAGRLRVLWFYDEGRLVVCSHGFVKRTRKTPSGEISRAQASYDVYRAAKEAKNLKLEE
jgi:phage-related protein